GIYDFLKKKNLSSLNELEKAGSPVKNSSITETTAVDATQTPETGKLSYAAQKEKARALGKAERQVKMIEEKISELEIEIAELESKMASGDASENTLAAYSNARTKLESEMEQWELANENLEKLK
ncbi:MAG: ABC transporter ATP-binding protein, partial [Muribaculaceae bacterium]|nr:ABC transporter ATP-binding protein [Muribaculaceae bacterium]